MDYNKFYGIMGKIERYLNDFRNVIESEKIRIKDFKLLGLLSDIVDVDSFLGLSDKEILDIYNHDCMDEFTKIVEKYNQIDEALNVILEKESVSFKAENENGNEFFDEIYKTCEIKDYWINTKKTMDFFIHTINRWNSLIKENDAKKTSEDNMSPAVADAIKTKINGDPSPEVLKRIDKSIPGIIMDEEKNSNAFRYLFHLLNHYLGLLIYEDKMSAKALEEIYSVYVVNIFPKIDEIKASEKLEEIGKYRMEILKVLYKINKEINRKLTNANEAESDILNKMESLIKYSISTIMDNKSDILSDNTIYNLLLELSPDGVQNEVASDKGKEDIDAIINDIISGNNNQKSLTKEDIETLMASCSEGELDPLNVNDLYIAQIGDLTNVLKLDDNTFEFFGKFFGNIRTILKYIGDHKFQEYYTGTIINELREYESFNEYGEHCLAIDPQKIENLKSLSQDKRDEIYLKLGSYSEVTLHSIVEAIKKYENLCSDSILNYYHMMALGENAVFDFKNEEIKPTGR